MIAYTRLLLTVTTITSAASFTPNFVVIQVSDLGFNDVSFNDGGVSQLITSNLHRYSTVSTKFTNYYVSPSDHGSRSALLTGKHPAQLGTQFDVKDWTRPVAVDPKVPMAQELLKNIGYQTHAVGMWDMGFYSSDHIPENRGFDTFSGSYLPYGDYRTHYAKDQAGHNGFDLHKSRREWALDEFKPELYANLSKQIIANHDKSKPLYMHVAFQAPQIDDVDTVCVRGGDSQKIPNDYWREIPSSVTDNARRCYLALVKAVDRAFGVIMHALEDKLMLQNTVVLFTSTSGGPSAGPGFNAASNSPFRGSKMTGWEGGVRGTALLYSTMLPDKRSSNCLLHISDWMPTLARFLQLAKSDKSEALMNELRMLDLYGKDQFDCINSNAASRRDSIIHFLYGNSFSMMKDNYKMLFDGSGYLSGMDERYSVQPHSTITCLPENNEGAQCLPKLQTCLFYISTDLCEVKNIAPSSEDRIIYMMEDIREFNRTIDYFVKPEPDPQGDPSVNGGWWLPWKESNNAQSNSPISKFISLSVAALTIALFVI